jgi:transcriptional regulator with XRE-family HTH domain
MLAPTAQGQRQIIGERTLLQRRRRKLSQRPTAAALGWGPNRVGQVERAEIDLDTFELYALAGALNCTVEYLLGIVVDPESTSRTGWYEDTPADLRPLAA